ncbi:MAG: hypothetical protein PHH06_04915 [Candidatus Gracilibacteria bacterium]|nr:hypothetical protein [Candidatus Gracilibacteria bacterium]
MQKSNKKASILLWAIFLSIIISVAFIGVSTKVSKKLRDNISFKEDVSIQNQIQNKLNKKDFTNEVFINGEKIYFESSNSIQRNLKKDEKIILNFSTGTSIDISLYNGGPIIYTFTSTPSGIQTGSGLIKDYDNIIGNLQGSDTNLKLEITNLGGYTSLGINSTSDFTSGEKSYTITQIIGNKELIKTSRNLKTN